MVEIVDMTDEQLARVGGMPGSIEDYRRTMEFRRRTLRLQRDVGRAQIRAANWTVVSAIAVMATVIVTAVGLRLDWIHLASPTKPNQIQSETAHD